MNIIKRNLLNTLISLLEDTPTGPYTPGQVLIDSSVSAPSGTTFVLESDGIYKLGLVGGGGGTADAYYKYNSSTYYHSYGTGMSGAAFIGNVQLTAGTYTIQDGSGGGACVQRSGTAQASGGKDAIFGNAVAHGASDITAQQSSKSSGSVTCTTYATADVPYTIISYLVYHSGSGTNKGTSYERSTTNCPDSSYGASVCSEYAPSGHDGTGGYIFNSTATSGTDGWLYLQFLSYS